MKGNDNMRYGIICAMDEELKDLLENLEDRTDKEVGGTEFYTGKIKGKEVVLVRCGIGKVQSGITTALMIVEFNVDCVINSGSAGGIRQRYTAVQRWLRRRSQDHQQRQVYPRRAEQRGLGEKAKRPQRRRQEGRSRPAEDCL